MCFHSSVSFLLAESLAGLDDVSLDHVNPLITSCPRLPSCDCSFSEDFQERRFAKDFYNERRRTSILALLEFIILSKKHADTLLTQYIFSYLGKLATLEDIEKLGEFPKIFLKNIFQVSSVTPSMSPLIGQQLYQFFKKTCSLQEKELTEAFLSALHHTTPEGFNEEQSYDIMETIRSMYVSKAEEVEEIDEQRVKDNIAAVQALTSLARSTIIQKDKKTLSDLFIFGSEASEEILVPSMNLCMQCASSNENLETQVTKMLISELMYPAPLFENAEENVATYQTIGRSLVTCTRLYPSTSHQITQKLLDYLVSIYSKQTEDPTIRKEMILCLSDILRQQMHDHGVEHIRWVLDSLSHSLFIMYSDYIRRENELEKKEKERQLEVIVEALGSITCQLNHVMVSETVVPNLINRITYPDENFDALIIKQLTNIALLGHPSAYASVTDLLVNIYKNCLNYPENKFTHDTIPNAFAELASGLMEEALKQDLLIRILKLFLLLANQVYKQGVKKRTSVLGLLCYLLPILGDLVCRTSTSMDGSMTKLFSNVWYYCVMYRLVYPLEWTGVWFEGIQNIAMYMPPLTSEKSTTVLETTLTLESFKLSAGEVAAIKRELADILSTSQNNKSFLFSSDSFKSMGFGKCLYLLSVYHLEILRARGGNMIVLLSYLGDQSYRSDLAMSQAVTIIADQVFHAFLYEMKSRSNTEASTQRILTELIYALLVAFVHNDKSVRKASDKYILQLLDAFPQLLWNSKALTTLLDLTQAVGHGATLQGHATLRLNLPNSLETFTLPEDYAGRKLLLDDISRLCTLWLQTAKNYAPVETNCVLQEYCKQFQQSSVAFLHHEGFSLIVEMISKTTTSTEGHYSSKQSASSFVNSLNLKSVFLGKVGGMIQVSQSFPNGVATLESSFVSTLKKILDGLRTGTMVEPNLFRSHLSEAAAFVISQTSSTCRLLVHYLCWVPMVAYSGHSMETGVFIWSWLLAARPDLTSLVMHEISGAWSWSIEHSVGLFNSSIIPPSPLSIPKDHSNEFRIRDCLTFHHTIPGEPRAHCHMIDFLQERLTLSQKSNPSEMAILQHMLIHAISNPSALSEQPASLGVRFRLLLLCVNLLQHGFVTHVKMIELIMESIYNVAVNWFSKPPMWYDAPSRQVLEDDVHVLVDFARSLEESKPSPMAGISTTTSEVINRVLDTLPSRSNSSSTRDSRISNTLEHPSSHYGKHRLSLLLLLMGHEIDRMAAWNNPQNRIQLKLPNEGRYTVPEIFSAQWRRFIKTAWEVSPTLAVMLGERFPFVKSRSVIASYVIENAEYAWTIPGAITYLASPENTLRNLPALTNLLYWAASTPPVALELLGPSFQSHPCTTQYAIRVLRSFPPDTIVFYIPQLVQTIRYDKSGLVEAYLLSASQHSQVLAHQLIWNMQTYTEDPDKTQYPLAQKVTSLRQRIIDLFSPMFRKNYEREFQFFERVTAISGILKHGSPKGEQKLLLSQKLKEIEILPKLYLPTSPNTTVTGINPEKASPMQSAAKVPILVTFLVANVPALDAPTPLLGDVLISSPPLSSLPSSSSKKQSSAASSSSSSSSSSSGRKKKTKRSSKKTTEGSVDAAPSGVKGRSKGRKKKEKRRIKRSASVVDATSPDLISLSNDESNNSFNSGSSKPVAVSTQKKRKTHKRTKSSKLEIVKEVLPILPDADIHSQALIFKVGDDIRQDMLALQVVDLFKRILESVGLDLFLYPYRVVATSMDCGIIECVPHAQSRDQIGKQVEGSLYDYFRHRYGPENSLEFQNARNNFLKSMAAYSVVSYILQIKDRHNGNMLIDDFGHIVHIDFGFIFDISPGGGLRFERAPFKMSDEMLTLMGGEPSAEPFKWFMEYTAKAYLACRQHMDSILTLVTLTLDTGFPCFTDQTITNLRNRFCPYKSEKEAAQFIFSIIGEALSAFSSFTTLFYDVFQHYSNGIDY